MRAGASVCSPCMAGATGGVERSRGSLGVGEKNMVAKKISLAGMTKNSGLIEGERQNFGGCDLKRI